MRQYVLHLLGLKGTIIDGAYPYGAVYVASFDVEAHEGRGDVAWTRDKAKALRFPSAHVALEAWGRQSTVRPFRQDGRPNRPLTAFSMELVPIEV